MVGGWGGKHITQPHQSPQNPHKPPHTKYKHTLAIKVEWCVKRWGGEVGQGGQDSEERPREGPEIAAPRGARVGAAVRSPDIIRGREQEASRESGAGLKGGCDSAVATGGRRQD